MIDVNLIDKEKVLIIRMLSTADVCTIGLPVVRLLQQQMPNSEIHFLTFGQGGKLIRTAEPAIHVHCVKNEEWPDDFFLAMESFLGLAELIIGEQYQQIINLDTAFMPCFLSRFLKDAHEPVTGNFLSLTVQELLNQVQTQSLQADYVNNMASYLASTFSGMFKWQSNAWRYSPMPAGGYPEYYLAQCCGLPVSDISTQITLAPDKRLAKKAHSGKVIGLCFAQSEDGYLYPFQVQLKKALENAGFYVWQDVDVKGDVVRLLKMLAASDLMVSKPSIDRWYAQAANCKVLLISGDSDPAIFMPDFATETTPRCERHGTSEAATLLTDKLACSCDTAEDLLESIASIFTHLDEEQGHA